MLAFGGGRALGCYLSVATCTHKLWPALQARATQEPSCCWPARYNFHNWAYFIIIHVQRANVCHWSCTRWLRLCSRRTLLGHSVALVQRKLSYCFAVELALHACRWLPALQSGRPVPIGLVKVFFKKNKLQKKKSAFKFDCRILVFSISGRESNAELSYKHYPAFR